MPLSQNGIEIKTKLRPQLRNHFFVIQNEVIESDFELRFIHVVHNDKNN